MTSNKSVSIMVIISRAQRDALRKIVAEKIVQDLGKNCTVSSLCRDIISEYLEKNSCDSNTANSV